MAVDLHGSGGTAVRHVRLAAGLAVVAALVLWGAGEGRAAVVVNGTFDDGLAGWQTSGALFSTGRSCSTHPSLRRARHDCVDSRQRHRPQRREWETTSQEFGVATGNALANDSDPENDSLAIFDFTQPASGTAAPLAGGRFFYTPAPGFFGEDSFTDRDGDGLFDLLEAAFGGNETDPACRRSPELVLINGVPVLCFYERHNVGDFAYQLQYSSDLKTWQDADGVDGRPTTEELAREPFCERTDAVTIAPDVPSAPGTRTFLRLKVRKSLPRASQTGENEPGSNQA